MALPHLGCGPTSRGWSAVGEEIWGVTNFHPFRYCIWSGRRGRRAPVPLAFVAPQTETIDESTVICPDCGVDAVVPMSAVPDEDTLRRWHHDLITMVSRPGGEVLPYVEKR